MKNRRFKFLIITIILFSLCFIISTSLIISFNRKNAVNDINAKISLLINNKELEEQELLQILDSDGSIEELIDKYDLKVGSDYLVYSQSKYDKKIYVIVISDFVLFFIILIGLLIYFQYKNKKDIDNITELIKNINNKIYTLNLEEYSEDDLSKLRDEIYKTTLMLKNEAVESRRKEKTISDSVADISHQLKTPLTSISIMLDDILEDDKMDKNTRNKFLNSIQKQISDMNNLIVMLLQLSRFDANVVELNKDKINIKDLLFNIKDDLEINLEVKNIDLNINVDKNIILIGDSKWEKEALLNIIKNAIDHSNDNSSIDVTVNQNDFYTKIIVKDYGEGISEIDIKHIFDRFYKTKNSKGYGIGLNLANTIIEKDDGFIRVESTLGKGCEFVIKYMKNRG